MVTLGLEQPAKGWTLTHGRAEAVLVTLASGTADALVTDPPAGIAFMGKAWDRTAGRAAFVGWLTAILAECWRVLKPGAHGLVWTIPRTSHWTATALEDAGFEIRDVIAHLFGQGFPKSLDVGRAVNQTRYHGGAANPDGLRHVYRPGAPAAAAWEGWGTALKPAREDWILVRKPFAGTVAANVIAHGVGALNIDACRIETPGNTTPAHRLAGTRDREQYRTGTTAGGTIPNYLGRWPAHVVLDEEAAAELDAQSGDLTSGDLTPRHNLASSHFGNGAGHRPRQHFGGDTGGASRFFYTAKASQAERHARGFAVNGHPTVKPLELMRYLVRLITPPGGLVLDPFAGSGTTGIAALQEGCRFHGIEADEASVQTAHDRAGLLMHV
jgi:site-specific DNA-methyltransferase (adenine-specific)